MKSTAVLQTTENRLHLVARIQYTRAFILFPAGICLLRAKKPGIERDGATHVSTALQFVLVEFQE